MGQEMDKLATWQKVGGSVVLFGSLMAVLDSSLDWNFRPVIKMEFVQVAEKVDKIGKALKDVSDTQKQQGAIIRDALDIQERILKKMTDAEKKEAQKVIEWREKQVRDRDKEIQELKRQLGERRRREGP